MSSKLTLTVDKEVIEKAKVYAKEQGQSLSALIEAYLKRLTHLSSTEEENYPPIVRQLKGSVKVKEKDFNYKKVLEEERLKKHLKD